MNASRVSLTLHPGYAQSCAGRQEARYDFDREDGMIRIVREVMLPCALALLMLGPAAAQTVPKFEVDPTWPKTLPNNWIIGTIGGITVDAQDHIWINQRPSALDNREKAASLAPNVKCCVPAPPVIEFDQAGNVVQAWGGDGPGYKWGNDGHGIHGDRDKVVEVAGNLTPGGSSA